MADNVPLPTPPGTVAEGAAPKTMQVITLAQSPAVPTFPKLTVVKSGWVAYGPANDFPQQIISYTSKSPVQKSIIESTVTYVMGKGIRDSAANGQQYVGRPNSGENWDEVAEPVAKDYKTFGGFYLQVIVNKGSRTVSVFHQDFSTVRIGRIDEYGAPLSFRISNDWSKTQGKRKPPELEVWPGMKKAKKGVAYMFYHWDYEPGLRHYCVPNYFSGLEYVKADGSLGEFYNNSIQNGFTGSVVISMPSNPEEKKKEAFQKEFEDSFCGPTATTRVVILWGEDSAVKPTITPFNSSANADIYNNVEAIIFQKIISANRLASPTLAGVAGSGNLSGNAAEIIDAYVLYNYTVIEKMRRTLLDKLNIFTKINGTAPLQVEELEVLAKIRETDAGSEQILTIKDGNNPAAGAAVDSLASKLGVGGTQALTGILQNPEMTDAQKRGALATLFQLGEDEINSLMGKKETKLQKFFKKLWNKQ